MAGPGLSPSPWSQAQLPSSGPLGNLQGLHRKRNCSTCSLLGSHSTAAYALQEGQGPHRAAWGWRTVRVLMEGWQCRALSINRVCCDLPLSQVESISQVSVCAYDRCLPLLGCCLALIEILGSLKEWLQALRLSQGADEEAVSALLGHSGRGLCSLGIFNQGLHGVWGGQLQGLGVDRVWRCPVANQVPISTHRNIDGSQRRFWGVGG